MASDNTGEDMATIFKERLFCIKAADIRLSRDGRVMVRGRSAGKWTVENPRREQMLSGAVERLYRWDLGGRGSGVAYTRGQMVESMVAFAARSGIDVRKEPAWRARGSRQPLKAYPLGNAARIQANAFMVHEFVYIILSFYSPASNITFELYA